MIHNLIFGLRGFLGGDGALILPELELILFACGILIIDRWLAANEKYWSALLALAGVAFSGFTLYVQHGKIQALRAANPESPGLLGLHQSVLVDPLFLSFAGLLLVATALIVLFSVHYLEIVEDLRGSYYAQLLFVVAGMLLMISGVDMIVVFLGLQLVSFSFFRLTTFARQQQSTTIATRNFAFTWACSSFTLAAGFLLLYRLFQTTNLGRIGAILDVRLDNGVPFAGLNEGHAVVALAFVTAGIFVLLEAAPFHWFSPGVYESAPTPVSAFLATAAKAAVFALFLRCFAFLYLFAHEKWIHLWGAAAILSLLWGNIAALRQTNLKRMLAYGSIAHTGFLFLGLVSANEVSFTGILYYLGVNIFMTAGAFGILIVLQQRGVAIIQRSDLDGLYARNRTAAILLVIFMMSLAGVPPTAGFIAKYYLVKALFAAPHPELAYFAVANALLSVYYYGRVAARAWRKPASSPVVSESAAESATHASPPAITISNGQTIALTIATFVTLVAGLYPEPFLRLARYAFGQ